jgi:putative phosphoribosyl transferase
VAEIQVTAGPLAPEELEVTVPVEVVRLPANLTVPESPTGIVVFAHGCGSSRHSPRNQRVAETFNEAGIATLLLDLLTAAEEARDRGTGELRSEVELLARRLVGTIDWLRSGPLTGLPVGLLGTSTGAAAALMAAAARPEDIAAVVSRGRPDLAGPALTKVRAPTLLIVGGADELAALAAEWFSRHFEEAPAAEA